jgi:glycosyltransferase 2 family protein
MTFASASHAIAGGLFSKRAMHVLIGLGLAGLFLWLALRTTVPANAADAIMHADRRWLAAAVVLYALDLSIRVLRWRILLEHLVKIPYGSFARVLIVGYGVNVLLPARLGELFRVEYFKRIYDVPRAWGISSVLIERLLDGGAVITCLFAGLWLARSKVHEHLLALFVGGSVLFVSMFVGLALLAWLSRRRWIRRWAFARRHLGMIRPALQVMGNRAFIVAVGATLVIYALETAALGAVLMALGVTLTLPLVLVVVGAASLSTLLPSAPGFIGTYQFAFAVALQQFGLDGAIGVAAASLVQLSLFGPIVVGALAILALSARLYWKIRA